MRMDSVQIQNVLTSEECEQILLETKYGMLPSLTTDGEERILSDYRGSEQLRLNKEKYDWLYKRIENIIHKVNDSLFNFDIDGIEDLQLTRYTPNNGGYFKRHNDIIGKEPARKITAVIQMSNADEYEGGELKLQLNEVGTADKIKGHMVIFPSYVIHEVTPVTSGTRYTLVIWGIGPKFR